MSTRTAPQHAAIIAWTAVVLLASTALAAEDNTNNLRASPGPRLALLVGVEDYPNLAEHEQLDGCSNDVAAMKELLTDRFGFSEDDIVTLINEAATGAAIRTALETIVRRVDELTEDGSTAQVVFHFSGHGSQVADQAAGHPDRDEEDGLDETLVPFDALRQGGEQDIRDDELYTFVDAVCADGRARLWTVLDCCHSGTGIRGATKVRKLDRSLPVPTGAGGVVVPKRLAAGCVLLSACRATEVEPEYQDESGHYGLLTRFVVRVLLERPSLSTVSYATLREAIVARYRSDPSIVQPPTPQLEGDRTLLDEVVLAAGESLDRPPCWEVVPAGRDRRLAMLLAGQLHGVTAGSLYEIAASPEQLLHTGPGATPEEAAEPLGWLRIEEVRGTSALGRIVRWADEDRSETVDALLPPSFRRAFAIERYHEPGHLGIRLRVVRAVDLDRDGPPLGPGEVPWAVRDAIQKAPRPGEADWITWVQDESTCDVLLRIDGKYAALFPATGLAQSAPTAATRGGAAPASLRGGWGPIDLHQPERALVELQGFLRRIARVRNLLRLAATRGIGDAVEPPIGLQAVSVELDENYRVVKSEPWKASEGGIAMQLDDVYALRVVHHETTPGKPLYVTVLTIDSDMEIQVVLPYQEGIGLVDEQRLDAGAERITDAFLCSQPVGPRWAVALATREPNDFSILAQPALPRSRSSAAGGDTLRSYLLERTYFQSRGDRRFRPVKLHDDSWSATVLRWDVKPAGTGS